MGEWRAKWIGPAYDPRKDLGVFAFRSSIDLPVVPESLPVKISADNRYKLYVNGEMVAFGPQRGDERHWFYDHFDLSQFLAIGRNEIVALVWNFGWMAPMAQHTVRTAFVFDGEGLETPGAWEVAKIEGWDFDMMHSSIGEFYIDIGPGEIIGPSLTPNSKSENRSLDWRAPHTISQAEERGSNGGGTPWMLIPRTLPPMRYSLRQARPIVRRGFVGDFGIELADGEQLLGELKLEPGAKLLLDYGELLCAYPRLVVSGPASTEVSVTYAEALWQLDGSKGNRDEVSGKEMRGYQDKLILGGEPSVYEPLWWRTYRYLLIEVKNPTTQRVTLHSLDAIETGYPLVIESSFDADDMWVKPIWDVSVRTAERCAGETYFDCPYYEQLQYVGDTRIQALIGYYAGRDRRLQRNAVETLGWSIMENGLTQSRYPSRQTQVIPPFSLWWVMMLYDQLLYDEVPLIEANPGTGWHPRQTVPNTVTKAFDELRENQEHFWNFGDWVPDWRWGVPPGGIMSTVHALTAGMATVTAHKFVRPIAQGEEFSFEKFEWDNFIHDVHTSALVMANEDPDWHPSEHAEALFRVGQLMFGRKASTWPTKALADANAAKCTYYFSYYKHLAMFAREDAPFDYLTELQPWKEMIENGLSTFAENPEPVRSDCHAWSAHPMLGFFQIIAGVTSVAPAWKKARIAPHPGSLRRFDAGIAHPDGELRVAFEGGRLTIDTPVPADLVWKGKKELLVAGKHTV